MPNSGVGEQRGLLTAVLGPSQGTSRALGLLAETPHLDAPQPTDQACCLTLRVN
jgi:hypothetical protein